MDTHQGVTVRTLTGEEIAAHLPHLAALRIAVFAEWPYLYDGDEASEATYLRSFAGTADSVLVAAMDGSRVVGVATASPMTAQSPAFRAPLEARGHDTNAMCYFGESVLLPDYRGRGIGHAFFDHREAAARAMGARAACFAAVIRPGHHPARPADARQLEPFWRARGYAPVPDAITELAWKEPGEDEESAKPMQFWLRALAPEKATRPRAE